MQIIPYKDLGSFKLIDHYLRKYKKDPQIYCEIFKKKKVILDKLTSANTSKSALVYQRMLQAILKQTSNQLTRTTIKEELQTNKSLNIWFQQCIHSATQVYQQQLQIFNHYQNLLKIKQPQINQFKPQKQQLKQQDKKGKQKQKNSIKEYQSFVIKQQTNPIQKIKNQKQSQNTNKQEIQVITQKKQSQNISKQEAKDINQKKQSQNISKQEAKDINQKKQSQNISKQEAKDINQKKQQFSLDLVNSFKGLDYFMQYSQDSIKYQKLLTKKKEMLRKVKTKQLKAIDYKQLIQKNLQESKNDQIKLEIKDELTGLNGTDLASINTWFEQLITAAQSSIRDQQKVLQKLLKGNNKNDKIKLTQTMKKNQNIFMSFKVIDTLMSTYEKQKQEFIKLYKKKQLMINHLKEKKLTSKKYQKEIRQQVQKLSNDDELKQILNDELLDLFVKYDEKDQEWFQQVVNQSGEQFQQQTKRYKQYSKDIQINQKSTNILGMMNNSFIVQPGNELYPLQKLISLTTISQLLQHHKQNQQYCEKLKNKKKQLISKIQSKQLTGYKYKQKLSKLIQKLKEQYLIYKVKQQLQQLQYYFEGEQTQWFNDLVKQFRENTQIQSQNSILDINIKKQRRISVPTINQLGKFLYTPMQINNGTPSIKFQYLLRQLSNYESLIYYFKKHQNQQQVNRFTKQYYKPIKIQVMQLKQLILKNQDRKINIYQFGKKKIIKINYEMFYGVNVNQMKQKCIQTIKILLAADKSYKQYKTNLKKSSNTQNLNYASEAISRITKDINYINQFATNTNRLAIFPTVQQCQITRYKLDLNKLQPDQIEIQVNHIEGLGGERQLRIYVIEQQPRYTGIVQNGRQTIKTKFKISQNKMDEIIKGTDNRYLVFKIYQKGWFSTLQAQNNFQLNFLKDNTIKSKLSISQSISLEFTVKVHKPKKLTSLSLKDYKLKIYPDYEHLKFIEEEFIKKHMRLSRPSESEVT